MNERRKEEREKKLAKTKPHRQGKSKMMKKQENEEEGSVRREESRVEADCKTKKG